MSRAKALELIMKINRSGAFLVRKSSRSDGTDAITFGFVDKYKLI